MTPLVQVTSPSLFFMHELDHSKGHSTGSACLPNLISPGPLDSSAAADTSGDDFITFRRAFGPVTGRRRLYLHFPSRWRLGSDVCPKVHEGTKTRWREPLRGGRHHPFLLAPHASPLPSLCLPPPLEVFSSHNHNRSSRSELKGRELSLLRQ